MRICKSWILAKKTPLGADVMKVLIINKFLHPNGGSETYIFKLGAYLQSQGHPVQYFGMEQEGRIVGNRVESYTANMDFHGGSKLAKLLYPIKTIYSVEARKKIRREIGRASCRERV